MRRPFYVMVGLQALQLAYDLPRWVPPMRPMIVAAQELLGAGAFVCALIGLIRLMVRGPRWRTILAGVGIPVLAAWVIAVSAVSVFFVEPYLFGGHVERAQHCPDGRTVWAIDISFLDPEFSLEVNAGALPFAHQVKTVHSIDDLDLCAAITSP